MKRSILLAVTATMLACTGSIAFAQDGADYDGVYSMMDDNSDGMVSESEFHEYYDQEDIFETWDVNDDGVIDENEFGDGLFSYYDDDHDDYIDDAEWEDGIMVDDYGDNGFWDT